MNVELWREIQLMIKYKAEKEHSHWFTWGVIIFLFLSAFGWASKANDLEARVAYLEQQIGYTDARK